MGYKNYPTGEIARVIRNDRDQAKYLEARLEDTAELVWTPERDIQSIVKEVLDDLAVELQDGYEEGAEDLPTPFGSLAGWALGFVDWREVVEAAFPDETAYKIVSGIVEQMEV